MLYQSIFYINPTNTCLETKYSKPWYLVDMCNKLVIGIKTLYWSGVSNTLEIPWYLVNHVIQNKVFYMLDKHISGKNTMVSSKPCYSKQSFLHARQTHL
jgi:hypothetical protein